MIAVDASALLAFMFREPGHERVAEVMRASCMSAVNLCEVLGRFARDGHDVGEVLRAIRASPIQVVDFDEAQASRAAALVPRARPLGLSLGDRACLALALVRSIPALTADATWQRVDWGIDVEVLR